MRFWISLLLLFAVCGCASKTYVEQQKIRSIGFTPELSNLESVGSILSKDCSWSLLGRTLGGPPAIESALENAVNEKETDLLTSGQSTSSNNGAGKGRVRMLLNVQTWNESWTFLILGRKCLSLTAIAYR